MPKSATPADVAALVDPRLIADTLRDLVNIPSPTGHEAAAAEYLDSRLSALGLRSQVQRFAPDRANVIATLEGAGDGPAVMLNGHLDTSYTGLEPELTGIGYKNEATVVDDVWMYGNGVHNMKNALAGYVGVVDAIVRSGVTLRGDVTIAGVAGEIERSSWGRFEGPEYEGFGTGTSYGLAHGLVADMCILGEPTSNTIGLSNLGVNWVRIRTRGTMAHTQHAETAVNAIDQMERVMAVVREWGSAYRERARYGDLRPACDITAIEGGWPWRVSRTPVACDLFVCIRTPPGVTSAAVRRDLRGALATLAADPNPVETEIDFYVTHQAATIDRAEPVAVALHDAHAAVVGRAPEYRPRGAYMDSSLLIAHGIPTVVYGGSGRVRSDGRQRGWSPSEGEHTYLPDVVQNASVVTHAVVQLCSRSAGELGLPGIVATDPP